MSKTLQAFIALCSAFLIWGCFPIFVNAMSDLNAEEFLYVRISFSFLLLFLFYLFKNKLKEIFKLILKPKFLLFSAITGFLIALNWYLYIVAINTDQTIQASLGYFITPLINVLFGILFLKEKTDKWTLIAISFACFGIVYQMIALHIMPWLPLGIGGTFGIYGGLRKIFRMPPMAGLFAELLVLMPIVIIAWSLLANSGQSFDYIAHPKMILMIIGAGILTILPLMLFLYAVQYLSLTTVGLTQYSTPTIQFIIALVYFKEPFDTHRLIAFIFIWLGLIVYSSNLLWKQRRKSL